MNYYLVFFIVFAILFFIHKIYYEPTLYPIDNCSRKYNREKIYEFDNLLSKSECNQIIKMAKPTIKKSTVLNIESTHPGRTSSHTFIKSNNDLLKKIDKIVYSYLKIPIDHYEELQVVNYKAKQKYDPHYDACDKKEQICKDDIKRLGSLRYATFIIYLNDDFSGGETIFPKHNNRKVSPKTGKVVLFFNLNDNNTDIRYNSFHGGLPPNVGEKWMCNKWIRLKPIK